MNKARLDEELQKYLDTLEADGLTVFTMANGRARGALFHGSRFVNQLRAQHKLGILETYILGQACLCAAMTIPMMKDMEHNVIKYEGAGPQEGYSVEADSKGYVRGYLFTNPVPVTKALENWDLAQFMGPGSFTFSRVHKDDKYPQSSTVDVDGDNIAKDFATYFAQSEQINTAFNSSIQFDKEETTFSEAVDTEDFNALGIGPGLGTSEQTAIAIISQLRRTKCPVVVDADAINVLANHRAWVQQLPKGIIMTPHPKEFDRLDGPSSDSFERLMKARDLAERLQAYILLKGHHTSLCLPDGHIIFNSTGNAGMATAGSGDVLTGIITGLLARGYNQENACIVGMYLHGLAGDIAAKELGEESVIASDLIKNLPYAFKRLNE